MDLSWLSGALKAASASVRAFAVLVLALLLIGIYIWLVYGGKKTPVQSECDFIKQQNKELVSFLIEAKKEVEKLNVQPVSFIDNQQWSFTLAVSFDTIPNPKNAQQKLLSKFDSVLLKIKQDSINRQKSKA